MPHSFSDGQLLQQSILHVAVDESAKIDHVAARHAQLDLSPTWRGKKPTAEDRARYRAFEDSLDERQQLELALALHKRA